MRSLGMSELNLTNNAIEVLKRRYLTKDAEIFIELLKDKL